MEIAPIARLAVPTGTSAAAVILREPSGDAAIDGRRFAALSALDDEGFRAAFEELIVAGVYTVLSGRVLVLRISGGGSRAYAAAVSIRGSTPPATARAGLATHSATIATHAEDCDSTATLRTLLEAETKQRPIFHGMTAEGITYSGFDAQSAEPILSSLRSSVAHDAPTAAVALVFAGPALDIPHGLVVGLYAATV